MDVGEYLGGCPVVGGVKGYDFTVLANDDGRKGVLEGSAFSGCDADVEVLFHLWKLGDGGRGEIPMLEGLFDIVAGVGGAVTAQDPGRVVGGIEADTEQMRLAVEGWIGLEGLVDFGEVVAHAGAVIGEWAAGVDEGHDDDFAMELVQADLMAGLIEQRKVRDGVARCGDMILDSGLVVGARLRDDDDFFEAHVLWAGGIAVGKEGGRDEVAGMQFGEGGWIFKAIGHGHGVHQAGDGVVLERDFAAGRVGADYRATDWILLGGRIRGRVRCVVATAGGEDKCGHRQEKQYE